jgi:hypothetical protein
MLSALYPNGQAKMADTNPARDDKHFLMSFTLSNNDEKPKERTMCHKYVQQAH